MWDFQTALGDTIRGKYESEYVKIIEVERFPVNNMKNYWLDLKKSREIKEADDMWNKMRNILTRYKKKGKK